MRDAKELETMDGMKYLASVPDDEIIKSMQVLSGKIFVATDKRIYTLEDEKRLERLGGSEGVDLGGIDE